MQRTDGTTTYEYYYNGDRLTAMTVNGDPLYFIYGRGGEPFSVAYGATKYFYVTNLQGDVIALLNTGGDVVVSYTYDAWGNILSVTGSLAGTIGQLNPLRYRGYVYDTETRLYYLQSRYYDPEIGRFINADAFASTGQGLLGNNMFAYCGDNPVTREDQTGCRFELCTMDVGIDGYAYIYNQKSDPYASMPLGESTVGNDGCAIIATYNAMITLGDPRPFSEIYNFYSNKLMDNGNGGIFVGSVAQYFAEEGYQVLVFTSHTPPEVDFCSQNADACIMLYRYKSRNKIYGHFVEYSAIDSGYIGRNIGGSTETFYSPTLYGYKDTRYFMYGVYIFK